ncbi:hypothetical protein ExPCM20_03963 [Escherichia coli]|nr:hypothetical protein ExPCM20_03963 [Escherichia coli]
MPEQDGQTGGAQPDGGKNRHLANAGEGGEHHNQIRRHGGEQRQQQGIAHFRQALPRRNVIAVHHPLGEVIERVVSGNADNAHAHHQRHQV